MNHGRYRSSLTFLISIILSFVTLTGCTTSKIMPRYNGVMYESPDLALAARQKDLDSWLKQINRTEKPKIGSALIVIPSGPYIEKQLVLQTLHGPMTEGQRENMMKYFVTTELQFANFFKAAIAKRQIFEIFNAITSENPDKESFTEDCLISAGRLEPDDKSGWYIVKKGDASRVKHPIGYLTHDLPPIPRVVRWLDSVEKISRGK
ncbi:MAG: hypothetical protein HY896_03380 [Deltaproteobacteria bacterium]|nr:hypothetical protein [Deltaproteobacteria bacterium]